ncbi:MAG: hypothetical protein C5B60_00925 [Chloroflexi bacterium]|nr:MAG: hypothetical protein C5B60_00925 [Chloroflexota bacterium]
MALPQPFHSPSTTLITPECEAPGCHVAGDQYTMVRCSSCGGWFCAEHIAVEEGVTLVRPAPRVLKYLAYYQGICSACQQECQQTNR